MKKNAVKNAIRIAVYNQKGGCGKTISCCNIAGVLAKHYKKKVLIVDTDPQANLSKSLLGENIAQYEEEHGLDTWFGDHSTLADVIEGLPDHKDMVNQAIIKAKIVIRGGNPAKWRGIDILPGCRELATTRIRENGDMEGIISRIRHTLQRPYDYDYVLFDLPPALSDLSVVTLIASDYVLIPASADSNAIDGIAELMETIENIKANSDNKKLQIMGVFFTNFDARYSYDNQLYAMAGDTLGDYLIRTPIRRGSAAKSGMQLGCPLAWYQRTSLVAKDYEALTEEILRRIDSDTKRGNFEDGERSVQK